MGVNYSGKGKDTSLFLFSPIYQLYHVWLSPERFFHYVYHTKKMLPSHSYQNYSLTGIETHTIELMIYNSVTLGEAQFLLELPTQWTSSRTKVMYLRKLRVNAVLCLPRGH